MSDEVAKSVRPGETGLHALPEDIEPEFRVVVRAGHRRGIKLERFFWTSLKQLALSRRSTLGDTVEEISSLAGESGNLTSAIRVSCARWLAEENAGLRKLTSLRAAGALLSACPSPAFALSSTRKILAFNPAFQLLVRRQLPMEQGKESRYDLKLALDLNVADIFARLDADGDKPVVSGFVVGVADRRYRAQLSIVRAPISDSEVLLAFVSGG